jgi:hypothetical protein
MAKHRGARRRDVARKAMPPALISTAAIATVAAVGGVAVTNPESVAQTMYDLSALIVEGSSTNPTGAGVEDFYQGKFAADRDRVTVNFFTGPFGIYDELARNSADDDNVVMSSGWGAANASLVLSYLATHRGDEPVAGNALYVLDNNVARPNGGFGTRYPVFGLIGVNPVPTPTSPGAAVVDVGYEYDINGNTPAYFLNGVAMANSLAAYLDRRLNQDEVDLPVDDDGNLVGEAIDGRPLGAGCTSASPCRVQTDSGVARVEVVGQTTYISYESADLPLTRPLRTFGGEAGEHLADVLDPTLRPIIDFGYPGNDPLASPGAYKPAGLLPTLQETQKFGEELNEGVQESLARLTGSSSGQKKTVTVAPVKPVIRLSPNFSPPKLSGPRHAAVGKNPISTAIKNTIDTLTKPLKDLAPKPPKKPAGSDKHTGDDDAADGDK